MLEEATEGRLAGDPLDGQQRGQHDITAQVSDLGEFLGSGENAGQEAQAVFEGLITAAALLELREHAGQKIAEAMPVEEAGEGEEAGAAGNFLIGEADLNGFVGSLELNELGHCLVSRFVGGFGEVCHTPASLYQQWPQLLPHGYGLAGIWSRVSLQMTWVSCTSPLAGRRLATSAHRNFP